MAIRIGSNEWSDGEVLYADDLNDTNKALSSVFQQAGITMIDMLEDRTVTLSAGQRDGFGDAYITPDGRLKSVDITNILSAHDGNAYVSALNYLSNNGTISKTFSAGSGSTIITFSNDTNAFSSDMSAYSSFYIDPSQDNESIGVYFGKTFSAPTHIKTFSVRFEIFKFRYFRADYTSFILQTYDGSSWNNVTTLFGINEVGNYIDKISNLSYDLDETVSGIRVAFLTTSDSSNGSVTMNFYNISTINESSVVEIEHSIPTGTFSSTISNIYGVCKIKNWEDGNSISFKLTNSTEDSGWLDGLEPQTFTAFTSEPTKLYVKLTPKSTSPTTGYPSIYGCWIREL